MIRTFAYLFLTNEITAMFSVILRMRDLAALRPRIKIQGAEHFLCMNLQEIAAFTRERGTWRGFIGGINEGGKG
jgi:hypothetical protein